MSAIFTFSFILMASAFARSSNLPQEEPEYLARCREAFLQRTSIVQRLDCEGLTNCTKCYGELGCFHTGGHFLKWPERPVNVLPQSREKIGTKFLLFTRQDPESPRTLRANQPETVDGHFLPGAKTIFIVHGFIDNASRKWIKEMTAALLNSGLHSEEGGREQVVAVDWGSGALPPYTLATANTRVVGAEIALLINFLISHFPDEQVNASQFHIIGHSLGAHVAGYAGERVHGLARITSLDPAEPYFQGCHPSVRLDPTDAIFVDVIHTDARPFIIGVITSLAGFGMDDSCGHVDFYPNGGKDQPGCGKLQTIAVVLSDGLSEGIRHFTGCNHLRSLDFMTASITNTRNILPSFTAFPCDSFSQFQQGRCMSCDPRTVNSSSCARMGIDATPVHPSASGRRLFLATSDARPFAVKHYQVALALRTKGTRDEDGDVFLNLRGDHVITGSVQLNDKTMSLTRGATFLFLLKTTSVSGPSPVPNVSAELVWKCSSKFWNPFSYCFLRRPRIFPHFLRVQDGVVANSTYFCNGDGELKPDDTLTLTAQWRPCSSAIWHQDMGIRSEGKM